MAREESSTWKRSVRQASDIEWHASTVQTRHYSKTYLQTMPLQVNYYCSKASWGGIRSRKIFRTFFVGIRRRDGVCRCPVPKVPESDLSIGGERRQDGSCCRHQCHICMGKRFSPSIVDTTASTQECFEYRLSPLGNRQHSIRKPRPKPFCRSGFIQTKSMHINTYNSRQIALVGNHTA